MMVDLKKLAAGLTDEQLAELLARRYLATAGAQLVDHRMEEPVHDDPDEELTEVEWLVDRAQYMCDNDEVDALVPGLLKLLANEYLPPEPPVQRDPVDADELKKLLAQLRDECGYHVLVKRRRLATGTTVYLHITCDRNARPVSAYSNAHDAVGICRWYFQNSRMTSGSYSLAGGFDITVALYA